MNAAHPFDAAAATYDTDFSDRLLGRLLRQRVWDELEQLFVPGDSLLELGCGTGEDAIWLARRGIRVHATDAATAMLATARHKASDAGVSSHLSFAPLDLRRVDAATPLPTASEPAQLYDGALANFGVLNCLDDRRPLGQALARWILPGGYLVLVVMGPCCVWEIASFLARGKPSQALRRWRRDGVAAHVGDGDTLRVWYPSPGRLRRELLPWFAPLRTLAIGVLLPPSYHADHVARRPAIYRRLDALEQRLAGLWPAPLLADHFLLVMARRSN